MDDIIPCRSRFLYLVRFVFDNYFEVVVTSFFPILSSYSIFFTPFKAGFYPIFLVQGHPYIAYLSNLDMGHLMPNHLSTIVFWGERIRPKVRSRG